MDNNDNFALVPRPPGALEKADPGAKRILSGMVSDTLALAKKDSPQKPTFTALLGKDHFADMMELWLEWKLGATHSLRFFYFSRSSELMKLAEEHSFDLVFVYIGNVVWDISSDDGSWQGAASILGELKTRYGKLIVASQGMDLSAEFEPKGVLFLTAPFVLDDVWARLQPQLVAPVAVEDAETVFNRGMNFWCGTGVLQDCEEAVRWFRKAAEQGHAGAQFQLGICYQDGKGVPEDDEAAAKWYRLAAEKGNANAQHSLSNCYFKGWGVPQDFVEVAEWDRKAAEQGHAAAQLNLGICYFLGEGVPQDFTEAAQWYRKAAELGDSNAQYRLGLCCTQGQGVAPCDVEAAKWFLKAAEQGDSDAQYALANSYYYGRGVSKDYAEAIRWCRKAAEQGLADAQFMLGVSFTAGQGGENFMEGVTWLRKAAEQGNERAKKLLLQLQR